MTMWSAWARDALGKFERAARLRKTVAFDGDGPQGKVAGRDMLAFSSNDYLGLSSHPRVRAAAHAAIDQFGCSATSSRLIIGTRSLHEDLERLLAYWKDTERALVFSSGYAANVGALSTLGHEGTTIFSDALNHASIIDGCRLSKARTLVFRHRDIEHLSWLMEQTPGKKLVVTESVFSMDGDRTPLAELASLCVRHDALLVLDEAHGVLDPPIDFGDAEVLRVGTLSKTLGALGGFAAGPRPLIDLLVNRARTFIFTTGLSPPDTAAGLAALEIFMGDEGETLRNRLRARIEKLKPGHPSPIVPIIIGTDAAAVAASKRLLEQGIFVPAIRPPTVPDGTARLRVTLSAAHTDAMIERLKNALAELTAPPQASVV